MWMLLQSIRFERSRRRPAGRTQRGYSLLETLVVVSIIMIIAGMAIPNVLQFKMTATEASAVESVRTLNQACSLYRMEHGVYPAAIQDLNTGGATTSSSTDPVDSALASGLKGGYSFSYKATSVDSSGNVQSYSITAEPVSRGATGEKGFYADDSGPIRVNPTGTATVASPPIS